MSFLEKTSPVIANILTNERERQKRGIELIASENFTSGSVMRALGSCLTNKYSEGTPGKRYYGGNHYIDELERYTQDKAREAFRLNPAEWHVNVQPLSGSPANFAVMTGLLEPSDVIMGLDLPSGGHLSHGYQITTKNGEVKKLSAPAKYFTSHSYKTNPLTGLLDYQGIQELALEHKPKMLICGGSAYPRDWNYAKFREIADSVGAYLLCDMAHFSGLVAAEEHNDPFKFCDIVTTTTHKTLRGPRGALIFCRQKFAERIDKGVFPGCQGGPHNHQIAGIAVALEETLTSDYRHYIRQVKFNCKLLADLLMAKGYQLVTKGTENHLLLWDLRSIGITGSKFEKVCDLCEITLNKNTVPGDKSALSPGGVRIGTAAMTTRGWANDEIIRLADLLNRMVDLTVDIQNKSASKKLVDFNKVLQNDQEVKEQIEKIKTEVNTWASNYFLPGEEVTN